MSGTIQVKKKSVRNAIIVVVTLLVFATASYFIASYLSNEVYPRDEMILSLQREIDAKQNNLSGNVTLINNLTTQVTYLTTINNQLITSNEELTNQTKNLETEITQLNGLIQRIQGQINEMNRIIAIYQNPPNTPPLIP